MGCFFDRQMSCLFSDFLFYLCHVCIEMNFFCRRKNNGLWFCLSLHFCFVERRLELLLFVLACIADTESLLDLVGRCCLPEEHGMNNLLEFSICYYSLTKRDMVQNSLARQNRMVFVSVYWCPLTLQ